MKNNRDQENTPALDQVIKFKDYLIFPLSENDFPDLVQFCDKEIGKNYYNIESLKKSLEKSTKAGKISSLIAYTKDKKEIVAIRLTYAPGSWIDDVQKGVSPDLWDIAPQYVACFKSLFVSPQHQMHGLGKFLSSLSIEILKEQNAKAIVSYSSLNSPNNSSQKYLQSMGFKAVKEHKKFWEHIDYYCTHCSQRPCQCSALEMILYL